MKVLIVAPQPFFSPRGTPFSVYYRTLVTSELGHAADVLTYGQGRDVDIPNVRIIRIPAFHFLGRVRTGPSLLKLLLDAFMVAWTIALLVRNRYDVVHAHEEAVFWCRWLKPIFRFRLVYDMHSSLPQQLSNFDFTQLRSLHWMFERLENSAICGADSVITICPALRDYARTITDDSRKVLLIENSIFDPVRFAAVRADRSAIDDAVSLEPALEAWLQKRPPSHVLTYGGTLEAYQGIDKLIQSFALVVQREPRAGLLIVGGLPRQVEHYTALVRQLGIERDVYFTGQLPQSTAHHLVARAGACISPRFSGTNTPLKIYHLMSAGVPLIATRIESHTQVLADDIATLTGTSLDELADGIVRVLQFPDVARRKAQLGQRRYQERYSRDVYTSKMRRLFDQLALSAPAQHPAQSKVT